ncbi:unnamed protein product [Hymenolepis diminuta]|uniref:Uncharacterized protein n=1 Tax=Hymenolepis diminuta TaxID=6216 RepID=A0A0R3SLM5_HYMDI|nr:unnamed protein product [Hymenolepis diminuta]
MNNLEITNPDTNSECFSRFRGMRVRRERLDIFINTKEDYTSARRTSTSNVEAILEWRNASRDDGEGTARTTSFWDMFSLPELQATLDFIIGLFVEAIDIPLEWRFV